MLLTAPGLRPAVPLSPETAPPGQRQAVEFASFAVLVLGAGWVERHGAGLDGFWSVAPGLLTTVPLILVCRAWRLPLSWLFVAASLPVSIVATATLAPGGWAGSERSAAYGYGALTFVAVTAFARTPVRRLGAGLALGLVILDQFAQSWLAWWGSQDPARMLAGSFNWHNQYGAYCGAGVVLLFAVALITERGRLRGLSVILAAILMTGLLGSASRAVVGLAAGACVAAMVVAARAVGPVLAAWRAALIAATSLLIGVFLRSPLFFGDWSWPWAPLVGRTVESAGEASYQSLSGNGAARLTFWQAGFDIAREHPLLGTGLSTFGDASRWFVPVGSGRSIDPHNELVRGAAEGGLVGLAPLLVVLLLAGVVAVRQLVRWWRRPASMTADSTAVGAVFAAGVLLTHALVDFDWSYPSLTAAAGWSLALAFAGRVVMRPAAHPRRVGGLMLLLAVTVVCAAVGPVVQERSAAGLTAAGDPATPEDVTQARLRSAWSSLTPDHRLPARAVDRALARGDQAPQWAVRALQGRASVDSRAGLILAEGEFSRQSRQDALDRLRPLAQRDPLRGSDLVLGYADLLRQAGQDREAADVAVRLLTVYATHRASLTRASAVVSGAVRLSPGHPDAAACTGDLVAALDRRAPLLPLPVPCHAFAHEQVVR